MADNVQFRVDAVLGDTTQLQQQINNLRTNLNLTINNTQALQSIRAVQQQINDLQQSMNNMNFNFGSIGGNGRGGAVNNNGNALTAQFETTTLQKTEALYHQISNTVNGTVKSIQVLRNEQGQIVSGVVTVSNGYQTWRRNLEFVNGEYQRVIASGRDTISLEQRSKSLYDEREKRLRNISSIKKQLLTATGDERQVLQQQLQDEQRLSKLVANRISRKNSDGVAMYQTDEGEARIAQVKAELAQEEALARARVRDRQTTVEQNENYRQQLQLVKEIESLKNKEQTATDNTRPVLQAEIQRKEALLNNLQTQNQLTEAQQNEILKIQDKAQLQRQLVELKKQELNSSYGNLEEYTTGTIDSDELVKQTQWFQELNSQYNNTAQIVKSVSTTTNKYGEEIAKCTVKVQNADNQWETYTATINNTAGTLRVLKGETTEIQNHQMNLTSMLKSAIERFAVWGVAMKMWTEVGNMIKNCTSYVKDLDNAMTNIRIVTMDTKEATQELLDTYNQMGQELGASTTDIAEGAVDWLRQGFNQEDTAELVKDSTVLSKLALIDNAQATEYLTSALKGYKLEAKDAMSVIDQLTAIDLEAATSAGDMAEAMSRTANMAKTTGFKMNELLGVIATMSEVTQNSASTIGNSVKTLLSRMSNVKAGIEIDPESGEALNDVEKVLNRIGITLRDNQGNWYEYYDVLDEIANRWDEFSDIQKSQITTALGGTRQRENVLVMLENWQQVKQYAETGANSAGTAMEKYGIVLESVEAKQAQLTAKVQEFYSNILNSGFITGLLEIGKFLMDFINLGDGLVGKILLLTGAMIGLSVVWKTLQSTTVITNLLSLLKTIGSVTVGTVTLNGAFVNLGTSGIGALLVAIPKAIIGLVSLVAQFGFAEVSALGLKGALELLNINPIMLAISALITVVAGGIAIFNHFNVTLEEQHEKAQQAQSDYQEIANELQTVNNELKTTQERIVELEGKDSLTFIEKEELDTLKQTNAELEKRQYWLDLEAKKKKEIATEEANTAWDKDFNKSGEYQSRYEYIDNGQGGYSPKWITESEYIQEQIKYYGELEQQIQNLVNKKDQWTEEEKSQYESLVAEQEKTKDYLESTGSKIQTDFIDAYDVDDATKQKWINLQDTILEVLNPPTKESKLLEEIEKLPTTIQNKLKSGGLENLEEAFSDSSIDTKAYEDFVAVLEKIGITADEAKDYLNSLAKTANETNVIPLQSYATVLNNVKDKADALHTAQEEMNESGRLSADTVLELSKQFDNLDQYLTLTANGYKISQEGLDLLNTAMLSEYETSLNEAKAGALNILDQEHKKGLSYESTTEAIKEQLQAQLALARVATAQAQQDYSNLGIGGGGLQYYQPYLDALDTEQRIENAISSLENAQNNYNNAKQTLENIVANGSKGSSSSGSSGSSSKEWWEKSLDKQKEKLENNQITMATYIKNLENLRNKLKKGSDGWNEISKELQDAKLDNLNNQFDRGEITIDQYIKKLTELRKGYKKGTEGYKELTEQINKAKADKLADQYERGEISLKSYIKQLTKLRDSYKKNSEKWKEYNDLIKDTKLDNLNKQFENGEITIEEYIKGLKELRKGYKKTDDEYKELTQTINEKKADQLADQYERGEISLNQYVKGLKKIRDSYKKNSEKWKEYNDLIKDTKLDAYADQYERGEISATQYIKKLKQIQKTLDKDSELYKEIGDTIEEVLLEETEKWIDKLKESREVIEDSIDLLGDVNTDEERVKYAELLSDKYKKVQSDITKIQNKLKDANLTEEERKALQEELNDLLKEEVDIRDEIEDQVREYYENQKEQAEQQAELTKKQTLYNKEVELYGKEGKDLWEYNNNKEIEALQAIVDKRNEEKEALDEINEREELENNLLNAKLKLQNALNNKTTKILTKQEDGTWAYTFSANMADVKSAQDEIDSAQKSLNDYDWEQETKELEKQIDELNKNAENLANQYEDAEFWANREYEQTMNSIETAYGNIDALVQKWMDTYGTTTDKLTSSYQTLTTANNTLESSISKTATAINAMYETVGNNGSIKVTDGVKSFDTGGEIVGSGLALVHDKERVLSVKQNAQFMNLLDNIKTANKLIDVSKVSIQNYHQIGNNGIGDKTSQTIINGVSCNFPNITTTNGLQKAILELPNLARQQK